MDPLRLVAKACVNVIEFLLRKKPNQSEIS